MATATKPKTASKAKTSSKSSSKNGASTSRKTKVEGTYGIKSWDEKTWDGKDHKEQHGAKLTHAKIVHDFQGDLEGEASVQYVMSYVDDANATFTGLLHMNGKI